MQPPIAVGPVRNPNALPIVGPHAATRDLNLLANFFQVHFKASVHQYSIRVEQLEAPTADSIRDIVTKCLIKDRANRKEVSDRLGIHFVLLNNAIYSTFQHEEPIVLKSPDEGEPVQVTIAHQTKLDRVAHSDLFIGLFGRLVKNLIRGLGLKEIGRKLFDPTRMIPSRGFELWPGFSTACVGTPERLMVNVDVCTKVLRQETVLNVLEDIRRRCGRQGAQSLEQEAKERLVGKSVMTSYNQRFYLIKSFDFNKNCHQSFTGRDGTETTFLEYYRQRYQITIREPFQPLIVSEDRKTRNQIYLIPELCQTTGLTDVERANRGLMTTLDAEFKPDAGIRLQRSMHLLQSLEQHPRTQPSMAEWRLGIVQEPMAVRGKQLDIGVMEFGQKQRLLPERTANLDREMQKPVVKSGRWSPGILVVFFAEQHQTEYMEFRNLLEACRKQLGVEFSELRGIPIPQYDMLSSVKDTLVKNLSQSCTACVIIIPGRKKQGKHYDEIKRYLLRDLPVPSQVVLAETLKGRNLQSIVFKILVQICAKIGGVPWTMNDLPFACSRPTMIVGFNNYTRPGHAHGIFTMMASMNPSCTLYLPKLGEGNANFTMVNFVMQNTEAAVREFVTKNSTPNCPPTLPEYIIAYREGVSKGQQRKGILEEIEAMKAALAPLYVNQSVQVRLIYVVCSKTSNVRLFFDPTNSQTLGGLQNPPPGTYVAEPLTTESTEFFLNSQRPSRGLLAPINYNILLNEVTSIDEVPENLVKEAVAKLTNKLCYLYYNTSNPIKVPAPVHLAVRLAYFFTEHSSPKDKMIIHPHLENMCSAYFL